MKAREYLDKTARNFYISHEVADQYVSEIDGMQNDIKNDLPSGIELALSSKTYTNGCDAKNH